MLARPSEVATADPSTDANVVSSMYTTDDMEVVVCGK